MIVSLVRFASGLADDDVQARFEARADRYRDVPGLVEKLYLRYRETGEYGAVYVWESEDAMARFRQSALAESIATTYEVDGAPRSEVADVRLVVRAEGEHHTAVAN
jgi:heme-degrading monooxygenase HmoA